MTSVAAVMGLGKLACQYKLNLEDLLCGTKISRSAGYAALGAKL